MLSEPPLRDPLENPPPDPPLALAKERVGTPIKDNAMQAAMSLVVVVTGVLSMKKVAVQGRRNRPYRTRNIHRKTEESVGAWNYSLFDVSAAPRYNTLQQSVFTFR